MRLSNILDRIRAEPAHRWTVRAMADAAIMSSQTFVRRFRNATGMIPGAWLAEQRLAVARDLLETTDLSMERVAEQAGLGSAANLRLHFTNRIGIAPGQYRRQFGATVPANHGERRAVGS